MCHASGVKVVASHQGRVGTLTGTTTKDSVQTVQNSLIWVRINSSKKLIFHLLYCQPPLYIYGEANILCIFFSQGNYCPICFKCYEDNDYDSQMMQCGTCNHWVHAKCEDLTGDFFFFALMMKIVRALNGIYAVLHLNAACQLKL